MPEKRKYDSTSNPSQEESDLSQRGSESDKRVKQNSDHRPTSFNVPKYLYRQGDAPSSLGKRKEIEDTNNQRDEAGIIEGQDVMKKVRQMSADQMKLAQERLTEADKIKRQQEYNEYLMQRRDET